MTTQRPNQQRTRRERRGCNRCRPCAGSLSLGRQPAISGRKEVTMQMNPYLSFKGECEAAFKFYEQCLGGQLGAIFRYAGTPLADQVPADWQDKIMHGSMILGDQVLMGADIAPDQYEEPRSFSI